MGVKTETMTIHMCGLTDVQFKEKYAIEALDKLLSENSPEIMDGFRDSLEQAIPQVKEQLKGNAAFGEDTITELRNLFSSPQKLLAARLVINTLVGVVSAAMEEIGSDSDGIDFEEED